MELIKQSWPWYVAGPLIALSMYLLMYFGKRFGISSNFRTLCAIGGAGKFAEYFRIDWKEHKWGLVFVAGTIIGGFLASQFLMETTVVDISEATKANLLQYMDDPGSSFVPKSIFSWEGLLSTKGIIMIVIGGFLVGFGTRYANGCTSGHAISGLSNLQFPSLIAAIGFYIGGLIVTWLILPTLLSL